MTDRWCATMSCSSRAMRARSSMTVRARVLSAIASCVSSRAATASPRLRSDSPTASAASEKSSGARAPERVMGAMDPHDAERRRTGGAAGAANEEAAADHELREQEQRDAQARHGQCRVLRAQDRDGEEHGRRCGEQWPSPRQREWHECEDAQHDRPGRTERASIRLKAARLDDGEQREPADQGEFAGTARELMAHDPILVAPHAARIAPANDLRPHPRG